VRFCRAVLGITSLFSDKIVEKLTNLHWHINLPISASDMETRPVGVLHFVALFSGKIIGNGLSALLTTWKVNHEPRL